MDHMIQCTILIQLTKWSIFNVPSSEVRDVAQANTLLHIVLTVLPSINHTGILQHSTLTCDADSRHTARYGFNDSISSTRMSAPST